MMEEDDILREILLELRESRLKQKTMASMSPTGSYAVNMDFASLYPSTMTMKLSRKPFLRKRKANRIYGDIESNSKIE
jgi:hypothetical protein